MEKYEVGQVIDKFVNHEEGMHFDIDDSGATMLVFFKKPTQEEIAQFASGKNFEIRFTELYNVIMMTAKIGNLNWMDAPYTPHLSKNLTKFELPNEGQGLGLLLVLVDAVKGQIKHMKIMGLSERFTKRLFGASMERKMDDSFDINEYERTLKRIYTTYTTNQIVKLSRDYCKFN